MPAPAQVIEDVLGLFGRSPARTLIGDDRLDAEGAHALEVLLEVLDAARRAPRMLGPRRLGGRHAAVELERAQRRHQHDRVRPESRRAALDVEELLGAEVEPEARLGEHHVRAPQHQPRGDDAVAAVRDVAERTAVDERGRALDGLHQVGQHRVAQQRRHRALGAQVAARRPASPSRLKPTRMRPRRALRSA